jgi:hypothetical protein
MPAPDSAQKPEIIEQIMHKERALITLTKSRHNFKAYNPINLTSSADHEVLKLESSLVSTVQAFVT